jgi:DNA-binding transcriptional regulator YhcF (GntR family)
MFDLRRDSPIPVHEQIAAQVVAHVASGALKGGAGLPEYRALAQQMITNPQVIERAYAELEFDGVLTKSPTGGMEITSDAAVICRVRQQHAARERIRQAVRDGLTASLTEAEVLKAVEQELAVPPAPAPSPARVPEGVKKLPHVSGHRDPQGIQVLSPQEGRRPPQPDRPPGSDIRPARR